MKRAINILLFTMLCLFCIMPDAMADTNYTANTTINIRAKADKSGKVLGKVQAGDTISVSSIEGDWAAIDFKGKTAYVSKEYITEVVVETEDTMEEDDSTDNTTSTIVLFALSIGIFCVVYILNKGKRTENVNDMTMTNSITGELTDKTNKLAALVSEQVEKGTEKIEHIDKMRSAFNSIAENLNETGSPKVSDIKTYSQTRVYYRTDYSIPEYSGELSTSKTRRAQDKEKRAIRKSTDKIFKTLDGVPLISVFSKVGKGVVDVSRAVGDYTEGMDRITQDEIKNLKKIQKKNLKVNHCVVIDISSKVQKYGNMFGYDKLHISHADSSISISYIGEILMTKKVELSKYEYITNIVMHNWC